MSETPTPRTDKAAYYMGREGEHRDSERWCDLLNESRAIERELIAAREEIEMMGIRYAAAEMHHANNMQEVIEQLTVAREELAKLKEEYGTWWAQKRIAIDELKEVTEQRDRLAEAIERLKELPETWRNECQGNWLRGGVVLQLADDFDAAVKGGADEIPR